MNKLDNAATTVEGVGKTIDGIGTSIKYTVIAGALVIAVFAFFEFKGMLNIVGNTVAVGVEKAGAIKEAGIDGATTGIAVAGENAKKLKDATGAAIATATDNVNVGELGKKADAAVDGTLGWLAKKKKLAAQLMAEEPECTTVNCGSISDLSNATE